MTASTPAPAPEPTAKKKRRDAYCFTIRGKIPLDMTNAATLTAAIDAVQAVEKTLPPGSECDVSATMGKL